MSAAAPHTTHTSHTVDIVEWYANRGNYQHSRTDNPVVATSSYHFGYDCSADVYDYARDSGEFPSRDWSPNWPIINYSAGFHTFGVEINDTALRFYVDNFTSFELALPPLCVTADTFHNHSAYMPFKPLYAILNVAVTPNANVSWWSAFGALMMLPPTPPTLTPHPTTPPETYGNTTTLFDWVRWYEWLPQSNE